MIHFVVLAAGDFTICEYLTETAPKLADRLQVVHYEDLATCTQFNRGTYVLAGLDQLSPAMERFVIQLCGQLAAAEGVRILNDPKHSLRRFDLLRRLHQLNYNEFGVARLGDDFTKLRYPVFLRAERSHDGAMTPLLNSRRQVEQAIGRALIQGHFLSDLMVVEFCSTVDGYGLYRKYAAFIVGNNVLARSINHGRHWMLKFRGSEFTRPLVQEERDYVVRNPHEAQLAEIFELAGIQYGRIDYSVKNGRIQTWEINLNPTIGHGPGASGNSVPADLQTYRIETRQYFYDRFREAWETMDSSMDVGPAVSLNFDRETIAAALPQEIRNGRILPTLRTILRPTKPVLEPLSLPLLGMLGKVGRLVGSKRN